MQVEYRGWVLYCDVEATRQAYATIAAEKPHKCDCISCQNFKALRARAYPADFLALLAELGVAWEWEVESYCYGPVGSDLFFYDCWFHFIGSVVVKGEPIREAEGDLIIEFYRDNLLRYDAFGNDQPLVQIDFWGNLPWVLEDRTWDGRTL